jgi:hypothetical protein
MSERLKGMPASPVARSRRTSVMRILRQVVHLVRVAAGAHVGTGNALVRVGCLLDHDLLLVWRRLAGAAAGGNEPEEARGKGEGDTQPEGGEHLLAHGGFDVVGLEDGLEDGDKGGVHGGYGYGGGEEEERLGLGDNSR